MKRILKIFVPVLLIIVILIVFWFLRNNKALAPTPSTSAAQSIQSTNKPTQITNFDKTQYSVTDPSSILVVVNKQNPLQPKTYAPSDLTAVGSGQYMRSEAAKALKSMFKDAADQGLTIQALSGYRSYQTQVAVYMKEIKNYGQTVADSESARPGYSEHQTGLAVDLGGGGCGIEDCFGKTKQGQWVANNAYKYGFIVRYTADKTAITGYRAEPWHIRYIGIALATEMHKQGIATLEEFFGLPAAPTY